MSTLIFVLEDRFNFTEADIYSQNTFAEHEIFSKFNKKSFNNDLSALNDTNQNSQNFYHV